MAGYVVTKDEEHEFHMGEGKIVALQDTLKSSEVLELQMDCDELYAVIAQFHSVPLPVRKNVVRWFGEMARFIFFNLRDEYSATLGKNLPEKEVQRVMA